MKSACVCDLIRDDSANWVAVEEHALAFEPLPENALAPGATLVIPRAQQGSSAHVVEDDPYAAIRSALSGLQGGPQ